MTGQLSSRLTGEDQELVLSLSKDQVMSQYSTSNLLMTVAWFNHSPRSTTNCATGRNFLYRRIVRQRLSGATIAM